MNKFLHEDIIGAGAVFCFIARKISLHKINNKPGDLRSEYTKIVGDNYKEYAYAKANPVLPEIFIQCLKMLQPKVFSQK